MKRLLVFSVFVLASLPTLAARASTVSYSGMFTTDDQVQLFTFELAAAGAVTLQTYSYAGGVDGSGMTVAAGGFDPVLTLYDASGMFLETNDDGACGVVGMDPVTQNCFDASMSLSLGAGSYTVALTEADNLPLGNLSDSFSQVGNGDFSCPEFLGQPGAFCDASPSQRGASYEVDITTPNAAVSATPEPAPVVLLLTGCGLVFCVRRRQVQVQI